MNSSITSGKYFYSDNLKIIYTAIMILITNIQINVLLAVRKSTFLLPAVTNATR